MIDEGTEALAGKRIEARADAAISGTAMSAHEWVALDIEDFKSISDPVLARFAAVAITENFDSPSYKSEFDLMGSEVAGSVKALYAQNAELSWVADERGSLGYAFDLLEQEDQARKWSPLEAEQQAQAALDKYSGINSADPRTLAFEQDLHIANMARNAMFSEPYRKALLAAQPEVAKLVTEHPVLPAAELMNATFVGKIVAINGANVEMKIGRSSSEIVAHPRLGLSGDNVEVGQVATIKYEQGRGLVNNHELQREQKGLGR